MFGTKGNPFLLAVLAVEPWAFGAVDVCVLAQCHTPSPRCCIWGQNTIQKRIIICVTIFRNEKPFVSLSRIQTKRKKKKAEI